MERAEQPWTLLLFLFLLLLGLASVFGDVTEYFCNCLGGSNCVMVFGDYQFLVDGSVSLADEVGVATVYNAVLLTVNEQRWHFAASY